MGWPYGETVVLHGRQVTGTDGDGNDVYADTDVTLTGCPVWPADGNGSGGNEQTDARDTVIWGYKIMLPPATDVAAVDEVTLYGGRFEIVGEPGRDNNPITGTRVLTIAVRRVTG